MSKLTIANFDFGQPVISTNSQNKNKTDIPNDILILVDAYWENKGMKIRFIPHQMGSAMLKDNICITLIVVFVFEYNDSTHNKDNAEFELTFKLSDDTIYSKQELKKIKITGDTIKYNILKDNNGRIVTKDNRMCYYYEINNFSSDLSEIQQ